MRIYTQKKKNDQYSFVRESSTFVQTKFSFLRLKKKKKKTLSPNDNIYHQPQHEHFSLIRKRDMIVHDMCTFVRQQFSFVEFSKEKVITEWKF